MNMHGSMPKLGAAQDCGISDYFNERHFALRELVGHAHRLGFSNGFLHGSLYVYAGGGNMGNHHVERHLIDLGLLTTEQELSFQGQRMLRFLHNTTTAKPYLWAEDLAKNKERLAAVLKPAELVLA